MNFDKFKETPQVQNDSRPQDLPQFSKEQEYKVPSRDSGYGSSIHSETGFQDEYDDNKQEELSRKTDEAVTKDYHDKPKLVKRQIFFDFVPPPLNTFEYVMTKLSKIEHLLHQKFATQSSEPWLNKYMSFTFVHGNHMDEKQALLALFDAEPEDRQKDDNNSGIVVVYMDKEITFDELENMVRNTGSLEIKGSATFLAVHSEQLLRDRSKLRRVLRPVLGEGLKVIDGNRNMDALYIRFADVASQAFKDIRNRIYDVNEKHKGDKILRTVKERFFALCRLYNEDTKDNHWKTSKKIVLSRSAYQRLKDQGLQGYTTENNTLILCFRRLPTSEKITENMIPLEIRMRYPKLKIVEIMGPLYTNHHSIVGGGKLHPFQDNADKYGTVGMFGTICQNGTTIRSCCISSPHVISLGQTAYILNGTVELGKCIWPPNANEYSVNVADISVIKLESIDIKINRKVDGPVTSFNGDRSILKKRKVYKFGATTSKTIGFIRDPDFVLTIGNPVGVFLIEPEDADDDSSQFSEPGDSGAIVLTKFGQNVVALSMIFGGNVTLEGVCRNDSVAVDLKEAMQRFEDKNEGQSVRLDTL